MKPQHPSAVQILTFLAITIATIMYCLYIFNPSIYDFSPPLQEPTLQQTLNEINTSQSDNGLTDFVKTESNVLIATIHTDDQFFLTFLDHPSTAPQTYKRYCDLLIILNESYKLNVVRVIFISRNNTRIVTNTSLTQCKEILNVETN